eukprot:409651_1
MSIDYSEFIDTIAITVDDYDGPIDTHLQNNDSELQNDNHPHNPHLDQESLQEPLEQRPDKAEIEQKQNDANQQHIFNKFENDKEKELQHTNVIDNQQQNGIVIEEKMDTINNVNTTDTTNLNNLSIG